LLLDKLAQPSIFLYLAFFLVFLFWFVSDFFDYFHFIVFS